MFWSDFNLISFLDIISTWNVFVFNPKRCLDGNWRKNDLFYDETVHFNAEFANWETPQQLHFKHNYNNFTFSGYFIQIYIA
jgi:hypothetical protein